jgi:outer membrane immunogenic protein
MQIARYFRRLLQKRYIEPMTVGVQLGVWGDLELMGDRMQKLLFGAVALAALAASASALAADISTAPISKAPPVMAPLYDWTGFYVGGHIGWSWAHTDSITTNTVTGALTPESEDRSNFHGGGQLGYDYMMPSRIVVGIEASVSSGNTDTTTTSNAAGTNVAGHESKTDASGSVRGRLGYAFSSLLLYGTGGWAWTTGSSTRTQVLGTTGLATPGTAESVSTHHDGWTLGAGLAYEFIRNWNVFGEYRYTSFESINVTFPIALRSTNSTTRSDSFTLGLNYQF